MTICEITLQQNGLYKLTLIESAWFFFSKRQIIGKNLTADNVKNTKVPWCIFSYGEGVSFDLSPKRIL